MAGITITCAAMTFKKIYSTISKSEWYFVAALTLVLMFATVLPLIFDYFTLPLGSFYLGRKLIAPDDQSVYFSYIEQVRAGAFRLENLFVIESGQTLLFNILWLMVGWLTKIFQLPAWAGFHLSRLLLIPAFAYFGYGFISYLFNQVKIRKLAFFLLMASAGWGVLLINHFATYPQNFHNGSPQWPLDLWVSESNTFSMLYFSPHFAASILLFLIIIFLMLLAWENNAWRYSFIAGLAALVLFSFHPFNIISIVAVLGLFALYRAISEKQIWRYAKHYLLLGTLSSPAVLYYWYLVNYDWVTSVRTSQNLTPMPPFSNTVIGYLPLIFFAGLGVLKLVRAKAFNPKHSFLIVWAAAQFVIVYLPIPWQRRMIEGLHIPLAMLAALGIVFLTQRFPRLGSQSIFIRASLLILIFCLTPLSRVSLDSSMIEAKAGHLYIDQKEAEAMLWLKKQKDNTDVRVISHFDNSTIIAGLAGVTVFAGHVVESPNAAQKKVDIANFYGGNQSPETREEFLDFYNLTYVYFGSREQALGSFNPNLENYLKLVFENSLVKIYSVL